MCERENVLNCVRFTQNAWDLEGLVGWSGISSTTLDRFQVDFRYPIQFKTKRCPIQFEKQKPFAIAERQDSEIWKWKIQCIGHHLWASTHEEINDSDKLTNFKQKIKSWEGNCCICRLYKVSTNGLGSLQFYFSSLKEQRIIIFFTLLTVISLLATCLLQFPTLKKL